MLIPREIRLPADAIHGLRRSLAREVGAQEAARVLQDAGYAAGDFLADRLGRAADTDGLGTTPAASFWVRLSAVVRELGWGTLRHEDLHPGVGALVASDWFEVEPTGSGPSCPFTTGALANVLGRTAGREVAVLQVPDPDGQRGGARFVFGSIEVMDGLYAQMRGGQDLQATLAALG